MKSFNSSAKNAKDAKNSTAMMFFCDFRVLCGRMFYP